MTKCANCENEAFFAYVLTEFIQIPYCSRDLPSFAKNGNPRLVRIEADTAKPSKKKKEAEVVEEPVIEEAPVEELIDEGELEVEEGI
jgi:hypothetical protein